MSDRLERYRPLLQLLARKLELDDRFRRRFDSSDLVQETMLKAHQGISDFRGVTDAELIAWLQHILERVAVDEIRKATAQKRDVGLERSLESLLQDSSTRLEAFIAADMPVLDEAERREELLRLAVAMELLPPDQRDVIILRDLNEMPVRSIAEQMGRTEKSVAGLLLRGREQLRRLMKEESERDATSSPTHGRDA